MNKIISFPHLGSYYIPIKYILSNITSCEIIIPEENNKHTIAIGSRYSPSEVCMPFKYNLGNYINALNKGATILIQAGGGCRYGYYAELQEQILKDLGYNFEFINLIENNHISIKKLYKLSKKLNPKLNIFIFLNYLIKGFLILIYMDKLDDYLRKNMGYANNPTLFTKYENQMHNTYSNPQLTSIKIIKTYNHYKKLYHSITLKNIPRTKVLLIGELYSLMDLTSSHNLERTIINQGIEVIRYTNLTYLLLIKKFKHHYLLRKTKKYLKYHLGADGTESVYHALYHSKQGINGIIHIKSFSCVPEINAMPILSQISEDYHTPILYLSFDGENNISNIDTKLEAFYDMILSSNKLS